MGHIKKHVKNFDFIIFLTMVILICIGIYCIRQVGILNVDKEELFIKQLLGVAIGLVMISVILFIDYHFICNLSYILYIGIVSILAYLLLFGRPINNVKRWIVIAGIPFQPSEVTKVVLILFLAFLCNRFKEKLGKIYVILILFTVIILPVFLILLEPHLSSSMAILFVSCIIVYSSGMSYKVMGIISVVITPIVVGIVISVTVFHVELPFIKPYHIQRIFSFRSTDEAEDENGKYQQKQALTAIASGGVNGKMISENKSVRNYSRIYANESDFIFSVVGEEFGFIGSGIIIFLYLILVIRCLLIAAHAPDYMGQLICMGVSALLLFQTIVNIGVATNLLPNTGLSLPFISYGLTSLISSMLAVGLVLNIGLRRSGGFYHMK